MRVRAQISFGLASLAVLTLGWEAGQRVIAAEVTLGADASNSQNVAGKPQALHSSSPRISQVPVATTPGGTQTPSATPTPQTSDGGQSASGGTGSASGESSSGGTASGGGGVTPSGPADGNYVGATISTQYGNVQVQAVLSGGRIVDVITLQLPSSSQTSLKLSSNAAPILRSEVLSAQSSYVSNVSGATFTSEAYKTSLQSALDSAGF